MLWFVKGETSIVAKTIGEYLDLCLLDDVRLYLLDLLLITNNFVSVALYSHPCLTKGHESLSKYKRIAYSKGAKDTVIAREASRPTVSG